jgi:hypothetical protein
MVRSLAESFARQVSKQASDPSKRIEQIYLAALGRSANDEELERGRATLLDLEKAWREELESTQQPLEEAGQKALVTYCHTIFNTAEFLYVD